MGRKPKCTVEEKISAVEDYLNGIRSVSEIMIDLSIKSTRTIRNWILAYQNGGIEALCSVTANHSYSSEFKIEMVRKYINGEGSVTDLCARYGIPAHATLQNWISLYNANRELRDYDPKSEMYCMYKITDEVSLRSAIDKYIKFYAEERLQERFHCKTPLEVRSEALSAETPTQYPIAENKRIEAYKAKWCA